MGAAAESAAVVEAAEATIICIRCKRCMPREQIDQETYNCVDTVACVFCECVWSPVGAVHAESAHVFYHNVTHRRSFTKFGASLPTETAIETFPQSPRPF